MKTLTPKISRPSPAHRLASLLLARRQYALALLLALIVTAVSLRNPRFLSLQNLADLLANSAQTTLIAAGVMLVIIAGEIDISVGSSLGLLTAFLGTLAAPTTATIPGLGLPIPLAILLTLLAGTAIGLTNGLLVSLARIPSIIVTLAMLMALRSLTKMIMHRGNLISPDALYQFATGKFLHLPIPIYIMLAVLAATWLLLRHTPLGPRIYAVGSNPHAAALAGLSLSKIKILTFTLTGFLVALAAVITPLSTFNNGIGEGMELLVITCIVVGGVSITGGAGSVAGMFLAVLLLQSQKSFLIFLNLGQGLSKWDKALQGALILAAVLLDHTANQRKTRGGAQWTS